jgi:hypothetical protein
MGCAKKAVSVFVEVSNRGKRGKGVGVGVCLTED